MKGDCNSSHKVPSVGHESLFNETKSDVFLYSQIPKIEFVKRVNNTCLSTVPSEITWPMGLSWRNCFSIALIFFFATLIDHLLGARSFSRHIVPTFHETAEVGGCTDTIKGRVTSVLNEACMQRGCIFHKRVPSLILKLSKESVPDEMSLKLEKGALKKCWEP